MLGRAARKAAVPAQDLSAQLQAAAITGNLQPLLASVGSIPADLPLCSQRSRAPHESPQPSRACLMQAFRCMPGIWEAECVFFSKPKALWLSLVLQLHPDLNQCGTRFPASFE